jgi:hypothetical protein
VRGAAGFSHPTELMNQRGNVFRDLLRSEFVAHNGRHSVKVFFFCDATPEIPEASGAVSLMLTVRHA